MEHKDLDWMTEGEKAIYAETGVMLTGHMFDFLKRSDRGPWTFGAMSSSKDKIVSWLRIAFGCRLTGKKSKITNIDSQKIARTSDRPRWLLAVSHSLNVKFLSDFLRLWGADVVIAKTALEAAQIADHWDIDGAILYLDDHIDAELALSYLLRRRGIGFLVIATGGERSPLLALGGAVINDQWAIDEVRAGLERLPPQKLWGLNLKRDLSDDPS